MPTTWNRSPEDFHRIYSANTDAFYRSGSYTFAKELDSFMTSCALQLWSRGGGITPPMRYIPAVSPSPAGCSGG